MLALLKLHNRPGPAQLQCGFDLWTSWHIWHVLVRPQAGSKWKMYLQCLRSHECARTARIDGTGRTHIETATSKASGSHTASLCCKMYYIVLPTSAETAETSEELLWGPFQPTPWLAKWCWWVQRKPDHFATCGCWRPPGVFLVDNYGLYMAHTRSH